MGLRIKRVFSILKDLRTRIEKNLHIKEASY